MIRRDCTACVEYSKVGLTTLGQPRLSESAHPYLIKDKGQRQGQGQLSILRGRHRNRRRKFPVPATCHPRMGRQVDQLIRWPVGQNDTSLVDSLTSWPVDKGGNG